MSMRAPSAALVPHGNYGNTGFGFALDWLRSWDSWRFFSGCKTKWYEHRFNLNLLQLFLHKLYYKNFCGQAAKVKPGHIQSSGYASLCHCVPDLASGFNQLFFTTFENKHTCFFFESMYYLFIKITVQYQVWNTYRLVFCDARCTCPSGSSGLPSTDLWFCWEVESGERDSASALLCHRFAVDLKWA